jgi:phage gp36-like protein
MSSYASVVADLFVFTPAEKSLAGIPQAEQQAMLDATSSEADGYLKKQLTLPLQGPYPVELRLNICRIAYWRLLAGRRGVNPNAAADQVWEKFHDQSLAWLKGVAAGTVSLSAVTDASGSDAQQGVPDITTSPQRGFSTRGTRRRGDGFDT